ncbi:MAG: hypothetical protein R2752_13880 [Vicinamibacterales bacterium]
MHAQLLTRTKIFCGCSTAFWRAAEHSTCASVCLGLPGAARPQPACRGVAARAALAFGAASRLHVVCPQETTYPDPPAGYQTPTGRSPRAAASTSAPAGSGSFRAHPPWKRTPASRSTTASPTPDRATYSIPGIRSGVPLIEIVTEPDLRSAADAAECFSRIRETLVALGVNDGNMEEGSLRCDANVSVRPAGQTALGTKTEVKNVNSFRYLQKALEFEIERQIAIVAGGGAVEQETRLWNSDTGRTAPMRSKADAHDYRYFPEPDLPPLVVDAAWTSRRSRATCRSCPRRARHASSPRTG